MKKPLPNPPLIREGSKDAASASCPSPDKGRPGGVSSREALPPGWQRVNLGDVVDYGRTIKAEPSQIENNAWVLELEDIQKSTSKLLARVCYSDRESKSTKNKFEQGDVLYGKLRPYLDKVIIADQDGYCSTEIIPLKKSDYLDSRYLFYSLKSNEFIQYVSEVSYGVNMPRLGTQQGKNALFILAPLPEQIRIANKLDSLLAKVETAQTRLEKIPALLKRFRQAVLAAATSGELTEVIPSENAKIGDVCEVIGGLTKNAKRATFTNKLPYLRVANVYENEFRLGDVAEIGVLDKELERVLLLDGDLLLVEGNGSLDQVGRVALWDARISPCVHQNHLIKIRVNKEKLLPQYLLYYLMSPIGKKEIVSKATSGAGLYTLSLSKISSINVDLFDLNEQAEIVRRVESLFAMADTVEKQYQAAKARLDKLTQAILAKAFRGELVPQDPNDEPAAELLKRIQAERASPKPGSKTHAAN